MGRMVRGPPHPNCRAADADPGRGEADRDSLPPGEAGSMGGQSPPRACRFIPTRATMRRRVFRSFSTAPARARSRKPMPIAQMSGCHCRICTKPRNHCADAGGTDGGVSDGCGPNDGAYTEPVSSTCWFHNNSYANLILSPLRPRCRPECDLDHCKLDSIVIGCLRRLSRTSGDPFGPFLAPAQQNILEGPNAYLYCR